MNMGFVWTSTHDFMQRIYENSSKNYKKYTNNVALTKDKNTPSIIFIIYDTKKHLLYSDIQIQDWDMLQSIKYFDGE